jgi:hypothetical protein
LRQAAAKARCHCAISIFLVSVGNRDGRSAFQYILCACSKGCIAFESSTVEDRMTDVADKMARLRQLRTAALLALVIPAALVAGCSSQQTPPPQQPVATSPPPPPPPPPAPVVRG